MSTGATTCDSQAGVVYPWTPCLQLDLPKLGARLGAPWSRVAYSALARQFSTCESKSFVNRLRDNLRLNVGSFLFRMLLAVVLNLVRFFHEQVLVKQTNAQYPQRVSFPL